MADQNDPFAAIAEPIGKPVSGGEDDPFAAIAEAPKAAPPSTNGATMQAAASKGRATQFLEDLSHDLRQGGSRTVVGRTLGKLQGRGDKGFEGLESGTTPATADFLGSVPLGAAKTAQGIAETPEHPIAGPLKAVSGVAQMATIPSMVMGGPGASAAIEAIPSRKFAAELFKDVSEHAGDVPVSLTRAGDPLLRFKEMADAGGTMPKAINRLLQRATSPGGKPLTYDEARDIYSNLSALSAEDINRLNAPMRRQMGIVTQALKDDIGDAANQAGQAAKYYAAMKDYARASKLLRAASTIGTWAAKATVPGLLGYEGYQLYNKATK
jgi:hypothetical protein